MAATLKPDSDGAERLASSTNSTAEEWPDNHARAGVGGARDGGGRGILLFIFDIPNGAVILSPEKKSRLLAKLRELGGLKPQWHVSTLKKLAWISLPLGIVMMLISLNTNVPRYFLERHVGERALGIFGALSYLIVGGSTVIIALGQAATPRLAQYYADGKSKEFRGLLLKLCAFAAFLGGIGLLIAIVFGRQVLTLIYEAQYAEYQNEFIWVMFGSLLFFVGMFLNCGVTATRAFNRVLLPYAVMTVVTLSAAAILIQSHGILGAAWTLCAAGMSSFLMPIVVFMGLRRRARRAATP